MPEPPLFTERQAVPVMATDLEATEREESFEARARRRGANWIKRWCLRGGFHIGLACVPPSLATGREKTLIEQTQKQCKETAGLAIALSRGLILESLVHCDRLFFNSLFFRIQVHL